MPEQHPQVLSPTHGQTAPHIVEAQLGSSHWAREKQLEELGYGNEGGEHSGACALYHP